MVLVKDEIKLQAIALEVIQRNHRFQQMLPKVDGIHTDRHEVTPKASNHSGSVEIKAARQHPLGASADVRASPRKTPIVRRVTRTLRPGSPAGPTSSNSGHEGSVSIRVSAAPDPTTTVQQQPQQSQQGQQTQQQLQPSQQPQHHRQIAAAAPLAPHTAWRLGMLSSGAVPTASRQVSPSNSHAGPPPKLQTERSGLGILKPASATPSLWPANRTGPKVGRARSMDLQQPL